MRLRVRDPRALVVLSAALLGAAVAFPLGVIANHEFTDVPSSNTFHDDISAIAAVGVTTGCAAGKYCPKDFVTREQMAAFLNRLGALGPGKTPVVNADKVDGRDASDFVYVIDNESTSPVAIPNDTWQVFEQVTIDAPTEGFVLVVASMTIDRSSCNEGCFALGGIELGETALTATSQQQSIYLDHQRAHMTMTRVIPVAAGSNTLEVRLKRPMDSGTMYQVHGQISAIFSAFGETHS